MSRRLVHRPEPRGFTVCVTYEHPYREYPIYHGPRLDTRYAHPYFPGTVVYIGAAYVTDELVATDG